MVGALGGALAGQLVVFAQERRQFQGLEVMGQQHLRRIGHDAPPPNKLISLAAAVVATLARGR